MLVFSVFLCCDMLRVCLCFCLLCFLSFFVLFFGVCLLSPTVFVNCFCLAFGVCFFECLFVCLLSVLVCVPPCVSFFLFVVAAVGCVCGSRVCLNVFACICLFV